MSMVMRAVALGALFVSSCNPYNPDLGIRVPFKCGTTEPRCPDGYVPIEVPAPKYCQCESDDGSGGSSADAGGGSADSLGGFSCNNDPNEGASGNETIASPTVSSIGPSASSYVVDNLSICPVGDVDVYSMDIVTANTLIDVRAQYDQTQGMLTLDILNNSGTAVAQGSFIGSQLRATYTALTAGTYYARLQGQAGVQNNYDLQIMVTQ